MASRVGAEVTACANQMPGLGPVVAALSLGASATMSFRPKAPRSSKQNHLKAVKQERRKDGGNSCGTVLSLALGHGVSRHVVTRAMSELTGIQDVVIMEGRQIQNAYHHRVIPHGLRAAATARVITVE